MKQLSPQRWFGLLVGALLLVGAPRLAAQPTDVRSAITTMRDWQLQQTSYHLRIDTEGQFIKQVSDLYCYPIVGGRYWKMDCHTTKPSESRMIYEETPSDLVAYFPEIDYHVNTKMLPGYADVLVPTIQGFTDEDRILGQTKASAFAMKDGLYELTLVFDARKLKIDPPDADITMIFRFDATGRMHRIEQQRLGLTQISTLTYLTFDIDEVKALMPVTPDPSLADPDLTLQKAIEESIIYFMKQRQLQQNRL